MNTTYAVTNIRDRIFTIRRDLQQGTLVPTDQRLLPIIERLEEVELLANCLWWEVLGMQTRLSGGNFGNPKTDRLISV
jgi:hypothetical protein